MYDADQQHERNGRDHVGEGERDVLRQRDQQQIERAEREADEQVLQRMQPDARRPAPRQRT